MQDKYTADFGDYVKYGLLRKLATDLRLGLIWYRGKISEVNVHGDKINYLNSPANAKYDPELFDTLYSIVHSQKNRTIEAVEQSSIFKSDTIFFNQPLEYERSNHYLSHRRQRRDWFKEALKTTQPADIVFLDPDNGLEGKTCSPYTYPNGSKYVCYDEVNDLVQRQQSVVIYQHVRQIKAQTLLEQRLFEIREATTYSGEVLYVGLKAKNEGDSRFFLLLPAETHQVELKNQLNHYKQSAWLDFILF